MRTEIDRNWSYRSVTNRTDDHERKTDMDFKLELVAIPVTVLA